MNGLDGFWAAIDAQLMALRTATTVDQVLAILPPDSSASGAAFFGGGDGDEFMDSLLTAGWQMVDVEASYYWCAREPHGTGLLSYVEGDIYRGNQLVRE